MVVSQILLTQNLAGGGKLAAAWPAAGAVVLVSSAVHFSLAGLAIVFIASAAFGVLSVLPHEARTRLSKWKVVHRRSVKGLNTVFEVESEEAARYHYLSLIGAKLLIDPEGREVDHHGARHDCTMMRQEHLQDENGTWAVVTWEGFNRLRGYRFACQENARLFLESLHVPGVLMDPSGKEVQKNSVNPIAINTIRAKVLTKEDGEWKVVTEEGVRKFRVYFFDDEENAQIFFDGLFVERILINVDGAEVSSKGANLCALGRIRLYAKEEKLLAGLLPQGLLTSLLTGCCAVEPEREEPADLMAEVADPAKGLYRSRCVRWSTASWMETDSESEPEHVSGTTLQPSVRPP